MWIVLVMLAIILVACRPKDISIPSPVASLPAVEETPVPEMDSESQIVGKTLTPSPTAEVKLDSMATLLPENLLRLQPFEISSNLPMDVRPNGALLVEGDPPQLLRFGPQLQSKDLLDIDSGCLSTSPNGEWLAYCQFSDDSPTGQWLVVESAGQENQKKVPMGKHLIYFGDYLWLDNQRLIFTFLENPDEHPVIAYPMVVINPFSGEQVELASDYPELQVSYSGPASSMNFNYSDVVYDPSLDLVIYPDWLPGFSIILWDRQSNSVLAKVDGDIGSYPLWSPDARQFAVSLAYPKDSEKLIMEWFAVSREGQVERWTRFGEYFEDVRIGAANWSPDGQKLAFWLETTPNLCPGEHLEFGAYLAFLDVATKQVTNTCLPGLSYFAWPPIWSLDSRYVVVRDVNTNPPQVYLVDYEQGRAYDLTKFVHGKPIGWLISP